MLRSTLFRLPRAAKGFSALLFVFALSAARAYEVHVEPTFHYEDGGGVSGRFDSHAQTMAKIQEHWDDVGAYFNRTYTVSNLRPAEWSDTVNGVREHYDYDMTICGDPCTT